MSEEQTQEQPQAQPTPANAPEGNNSDTLTIIERADSIVKRLEEAEKRIDEKTKQYEMILSRQMMSGRAFGGTIQKTPQEIEAERDADEVQKILKRIT